VESAAALERITARLRSKGFHRVEAVLASEFQTHNGGRSTARTVDIGLGLRLRLGLGLEQ